MFQLSVVPANQKDIASLALSTISQNTKEISGEDLKKIFTHHTNAA